MAVTTDIDRLKRRVSLIETNIKVIMRYCWYIFTSTTIMSEPCYDYSDILGSPGSPVWIWSHVSYLFTTCTAHGADSDSCKFPIDDKWTKILILELIQNFSIIVY